MSGTSYRPIRPSEVVILPLPSHEPTSPALTCPCTLRVYIDFPFKARPSRPAALTPFFRRPQNFLSRATRRASYSRDARYEVGGHSIVPSWHHLRTTPNPVVATRTTPTANLAAAFGAFRGVRHSTMPPKYFIAEAEAKKRPGSPWYHIGVPPKHPPRLNDQRQLIPLRCKRSNHTAAHQKICHFHGASVEATGGGLPQLHHHANMAIHRNNDPQVSGGPQNHSVQELDQLRQGRVLQRHGSTLHVSRLNHITLITARVFDDAHIIHMIGVFRHV